MSSDPELTLWLWPEGLFPRRISYYLLIKHLVSSPPALLTGQTTAPNVTIKLIRFDKSNGLVHDDPSDKPPQGASTPCLRIRDQSPATEEHFIYESTSILLYLESIYGSQTPQVGPSIDDARAQATTADRLALLADEMAHGTYYLKHAVPQTSTWSGLPASDRSLPAAKNAHASMISCLAKLQRWAADDLEKTGWLTPGVGSGPGIVDVCLAAQRRYLELCYGGWDLFESEGLEELKVWYRRFQGQEWWAELEERDDVHPQELRYPKGCREI